MGHRESATRSQAHTTDFTIDTDPTLTAFAGVAPLGDLEPIQKFTGRKAAIIRIRKAIQVLTQAPRHARAADRRIVAGLTFRAAEYTLAQNRVRGRESLTRCRDVGD